VSLTRRSSLFAAPSAFGQILSPKTLFSAPQTLYPAPQILCPYHETREGCSLIVGLADVFRIGEQPTLSSSIQL